MPDADGVLTHDEVIAGSLEAPVDLETNILFIVKGSVLFFVVLSIFLVFVFSLAHLLKALDRKITRKRYGETSVDAGGSAGEVASGGSSRAHLD